MLSVRPVPAVKLSWRATGLSPALAGSAGGEAGAVGAAESDEPPPTTAVSPKAAGASSGMGGMGLAAGGEGATGGGVSTPGQQLITGAGERASTGPPHPLVLAAAAPARGQ